MKLRHLIHLTAFLATLLLIVGNAFSQEDSVFCKKFGNSVIIWNTNVLENCASRYKISVNLLGNDSIIITETDTIGPFENCICFYDLSVSLMGLPVGHYVVYLFRERLTRYSYPIDTIRYIGSTNFDITQIPLVIPSKAFYQSECKEQVGVLKGTGIPNNYSLSQNYPNPFNPLTQITYSMPKTTDVTIKIYDLLGREIATLVNEKKQAGDYKVTWNAEGLASGVYFYRMVAGEYIQTKQMILIR
jgi:hypothetical protein